MWSLGVIVYVLLTLARAQEWNLWRTIRAGQSNCIDSESFGKHLRTGFSEVSTVECSVLIPAPPKWCESYSSLEASFRDENMIVVFLQTRKPPKIGVSAGCCCHGHPRTGEMPFTGGIPQSDQQFSVVQSTFWDLSWSVSPQRFHQQQASAMWTWRPLSWREVTAGRPPIAFAFARLGVGETSRGPRFGVFLPSWWTNIGNSELRCS